MNSHSDRSACATPANTGTCRKAGQSRQALARLLTLLAWGAFLACVWQAAAAPTILSSAPANGATGVLPTTALTLTFSEAMNTTATTVMVIAGSQMVAVTPAWNAGKTILTCTPTTVLPGNQTITWVVSGGLSAAGGALGGTTYGMFTTMALSTGCDPSAAQLSLTVSKSSMYLQSSTNAPIPNPSSSNVFLACLSLPCPRDATNVSLQMPGGTVSNLALAYSGHLTLPDTSHASQPGFDTTYPAGNYTFAIQAMSSNQTVTVNLSPSLTSPPAPHLTNYLAAQAINPAQPFVLKWDPLAGGSASDVIYVEIYGGYFNTPALGNAGALNGTATSVTIPAGTLQASQTYSGCVTFYHSLLATNGTAYLTLTYRAATTEFGLQTGSGSTPLILTPAGWSGGSFYFQTTCTNGQALIAEYTTNLAPPHWTTLYSTNSPASSVRFGDPHAVTNRQLFYRVRTP